MANKTDNLPDKEYNPLLIRMLTELVKRIDEHRENFKKELENIKRTSQS